MPRHPDRFALARANAAPVIFLCLLFLFAPRTSPAAEAGALKHFDIPAGSASTALKHFAQQSGVELLYSSDMVEGVKTKAVRGDLSPRQALDRMLEGTDLVVTQGRSDGPLTISLAPAGRTDSTSDKKKIKMSKGHTLLAAIGVLFTSAAPAGLQAQTAPPPSASSAPSASAAGEEPVRLDPFSITGERATGYSVQDASSSSRLDLPYVDVPQTITVLTNELLNDLNTTIGREAIEWGQSILAGTNGTNGGGYNLRGLSVSQAYRDGFLTSTQAVERDAALYDRIEVVSGPASAAMGRGQAGGLINYVTKKPLELNAETVTFTAATDSYGRVDLDINRVLKIGAYRFPAFYENSDGTYGGSLNHLKKYGAGPSFLWNISPSVRLLVNVTGWKLYGPGLASEADYLDRTGTLFRLRQSIGQYVGSPWNPFQYPYPALDKQSWGYPGVGQDANVGESSIVLTDKWSDLVEMRLGLFADCMQDIYRFIDKAAQTNPDPGVPGNFLQPLTYNLSFSNAMSVRDQGDFLFTKTIAGIKNEIDVGYDAFALRSDAKSGSISAVNGVALTDQFYNPTNIPPPGFNIYTSAKPTADSTTYQHGIGYYVQYLGSFWNNHIDVLAGIRQDTTDTRTFNVVTQAYALNANQTTHAPRYSISFKPTPSTSVYYLVSYQEDPPTTTLEYTNFQPTGGAVAPPAGSPLYSTYIVGQVHAKLNEVGFKDNFLDGRLTATADYYHITQDGAVSSTPINDTSQATAVNPLAQLHYTLAYITSGTNYHGFEFSLTGRPAKHLTFTALYNIPEGQTLFGGTTLAPGAELIREGKLYGKYDWPFVGGDGLEFTGGFRELLGDWTIRSNSTVKWTSNQGRIDAGVAYYWHHREFEVRLYGANLTDDPQIDGTGQNAELRRYFISFKWSM